MGIRFEGTFSDGVTIDMSLGEHVDLPTLTTSFKQFVLGCGYIVDPASDVEFINFDKEQEEQDSTLMEVELENDALKEEIAKLKKRIKKLKRKTKHVQINAEFGKEEFMDAAVKLVVGNIGNTVEEPKKMFDCGKELCQGCALYRQGE